MFSIEHRVCSSIIVAILIAFPSAPVTAYGVFSSLEASDDSSRSHDRGAGQDMAPRLNDDLVKPVTRGGQPAHFSVDAGTFAD